MAAGMDTRVAMAAAGAQLEPAARRTAEHSVMQSAIEGDRARPLGARLATAPIAPPRTCCWPLWPNPDRPGPRPLLRRPDRGREGLLLGARRCRLCPLEDGLIARGPRALVAGRLWIDEGGD